MGNALRIAIERLGWYFGGGLHYILFLLALVYLIFHKDEKDSQRWLVGYSILFAAVYICPLTAYIIMEYCTGDLVYWRMLWLLPFSPAIAYAAARFCGRFKRAGAQVLCMAALTLCITASGRNPYVGEKAAYVRAHNLQKLPVDACQVCDVINASLEEGESALAVMPDDLNGYVRQYDASIRLVYGRRSKLRRERRRLHRQMNQENPRIRRIVRLSRKLGVNYVVFASNEKQHRRFERRGFRCVGQVGGYFVYKDVGIDNGKKRAL